MLSSPIKRRGSPPSRGYARFIALPSLLGWQLTGHMASAWSSRAPPVAYSASAKAMHWFVAAAVIVLLAVGPVMKRLVPEGSLRDNLYNFHEALARLS